MRSLLSALSLFWSRFGDPSPAANRTLAHIPSYVLDYAPFVHLFSNEQYWPGHIGEHLDNVTPYANYTPLEADIGNLDLSNLDKLNFYDRGRTIYLNSNDDPESNPEWLGGSKNKPDEPTELAEPIWEEHTRMERVNGKESWLEAPVDLEGARSQLQEHLKSDGPRIARAVASGGKSTAPTITIMIDKGHGIVDVFWFFFYSFNLGNSVFNVRFGNHVGDWEHTLIRFEHGKPKALFLSQHSQGDAYTYAAVEKIGKRPLVFSAVGTHAMYATEGVHAYVLPLGILHDVTDRGPLWDPSLNTYVYKYDLKSKKLTVGDVTPDAPVEWFYFNGRWGDKRYPLSDKRQYGLAGEFHYVTGPTGPQSKELGRIRVCPVRQQCNLRNWLPPAFEIVEHDYSFEDDEAFKGDKGILKGRLEDL